MKEKSTPPNTRKTAVKAEAPAKKTASKAAKAVKTPKVAKADSAEKPARATKAKPTTKKSAKPVTAPDAEVVAVAAYLNWCQRRNQGLPDDPVADWVDAEMAIGLSN